MTKVKKVIAILLVVLFLVTVTAGAASAVGPCSGNCKIQTLHATAVNAAQGSDDTSKTIIMNTPSEYYKPGNGIHDLITSQKTSMVTNYIKWFTVKQR